MLLKNPLLLQWIKNKYNLIDDKSDPDKVIEEAVKIIQDDDEINFDTLINEQLHSFYMLQP